MSEKATLLKICFETVTQKIVMRIWRTVDILLYKPAEQSQSKQKIIEDINKTVEAKNSLKRALNTIENDNVCFYTAGWIDLLQQFGFQP
mgnify:CR=1 FL=1